MWRDESRYPLHSIIAAQTGQRVAIPHEGCGKLCGGKIRSGKFGSVSRAVREVTIVKVQPMPVGGPVGEQDRSLREGWELPRTEAVMGRKIILGLFAASALAPNSGCVFNQYSSNPDERMQQLLYQSEDLRQIKNEWRRFWFNDQPSHLTPERIHGGII